VRARIFTAEDLAGVHLDLGCDEYKTHCLGVAAQRAIRAAGTAP
jgi:hypothetical protein